MYFVALVTIDESSRTEHRSKVSRNYGSISQSLRQPHSASRITSVKHPQILLLFLCVSALPLLPQSPGAAGSVKRLDPALDKLVPPAAVIEKVTGNLLFA